MTKIIRETTVDEWGNKRWGWWCDECEEGDFHSSPEGQQEGVENHLDTHGRICRELGCIEPH